MQSGSVNPLIRLDETVSPLSVCGDVTFCISVGVHLLCDFTPFREFVSEFQFHGDPWDYNIHHVISLKRRKLPWRAEESQIVLRTRIGDS